MAFYEVLKALTTALAPNQAVGLSSCNLPVAAALGDLLAIIGQQQDNSGNRVSCLILSSCSLNKFAFGEVAVPSDWDMPGGSLCSHLLFSSCMQPHCLYCSAGASEGKGQSVAPGHDEVCEAGRSVCNPGEQLFSTAPGLPWGHIPCFPVDIPWFSSLSHSAFHLFFMLAVQQGLPCVWDIRKLWAVQ